MDELAKLRDERLRKEKVLDKKISFSVRGFFSLLIFVLFVTGSFFAGRYVFPAGTSIGLPNFAAAIFSSGDLETSPENSLDETSLEAPPVNADEEAEDDGPTEEAETQEESSGAEQASEESEEAVEESAEETASDDGSGDESVISGDYTNVKLEFTKAPSYDWKDTWGKIDSIYYTITNNEAGTIKPAKFRIIIEGYESDDFIKLVDVPSVDKEIKAGEIAKHGFGVLIQYSESETDPSNVLLTLHLLDENNVVIAIAKQEFALN